MKKLIVFVGRSGSGKTYLCDWLEKEYDIPQIRTYTTRKPRDDQDYSHVWSTIEAYANCTDILCETKFGTDYYWTRLDQIDDDITQSLVVDVNGLIALYDTDIPMIVINVVADEYIRVERIVEAIRPFTDDDFILSRAYQTAYERIERDKGFELLKVDYVLDNNGRLEDTCKNLAKIIGDI